MPLNAQELCVKIKDLCDGEGAAVIAVVEKAGKASLVTHAPSVFQIIGMAQWLFEQVQNQRPVTDEQTAFSAAIKMTMPPSKLN